MNPICPKSGLLRKEPRVYAPPKIQTIKLNDRSMSMSWYCFPWLILATTVSRQMLLQQQDPHHNVVESSTSSSGDVQQVIDNGTAADAAAETTTIESCTFSLPRHHYVVYYVADLVLFYVTPLLVACVLYALIGRTLLGRRGGVGRTSSTAALTRRDAGGADRTLHEAPVGRYGSVATAAAAAAAGRGGSSNRNGVVVVLHRPSTTAAAADRSHRKGVAAVETTMPTMHRGSCCVNGDSGGGLQVVKMLAVVVASFATLWLPYRAYVVYNSFAVVRYENRWFLMCCRLAVYANSAVNPVLYNVMSVRFRTAFRRLLCPSVTRAGSRDHSAAGEASTSSDRRVHLKLSVLSNTSSGRQQQQQQQRFRSGSETPF